MTRFVRKGVKTVGEAPGTATYVGPAREGRARITRIAYDGADITQDVLPSAAALLASRCAERVSWVNVDGVHDVQAVQAIGDGFELHPLVTEDLAHTGQRPKLEDYDSHLFIVLRMLRWNNEADQIEDEQVSLVLGPTWVLSFQEHEGDVFEPIRDRLVSDRGRIRKLGSDYLAYALVDAVVDHYFAILEGLGDRVEQLGEDMADNPKRADLNEIRHLKHELLFMRKSIWPLREVLSQIQRGESRLIHDETTPYFRDVYDHTIQIIDTVEALRDMVSSLMDLYLSSMSNRLNEVMKVLTIIATLFIPLSFIAGVYGMNFTYMPELEWRYSYFVVLGLMLAAAAGMLMYFRRRRWL
jgi:magnesium transporter